MAPIDYYRILNIAKKSTIKEIKSAYRQLALKFHPDFNPNNPTAAEKFAQIKEAYEILSNSEKRRKYDFSYKPDNRPEVEPETPGETKPNAGQKKGKNLRYNLYITLEEVAAGCERSIRYIRKNGGEPETIQLKVKIPKGAFHQQRLKLVNYGDVDAKGTGDLFVIVHLHEHPIFIKNDINLRINVPVSYLDILLGSMIEIPTLKGVRKLKLRACEFDQLQYTMKGFGLPDAKNQFKGDLLIYCFVENPKKLTTQEKNAAQKLLNSWPKGEMMQQYKSYIKQQKGN